MRVGIVGHESAKFTAATEAEARAIIRACLNPGDVVVSGACHLGGIDIWAVEEAKKLKLNYKEYPPKKLSWEGGYKERNIQIAEDSDIVIVIVVKELPASYKGMRFSGCYHCHTTEHVKSGGCWTGNAATYLKKPAFWFTV